MTLMRPSSVHSLHCLEPRSYWSPRKTFRYCNHYFIQRPVDVRTEREAGWGAVSVAKNLPLNLPSLSAHDGWIWVLFFFLFLFVCMFALLRITAKSWPIMIMSREKKGQSRVGRIDLSCPLGQPIRTRDTFPLLCPLAKGRVKEHKLSQNCFLVKAVLVLHVPQCHISS